MCAIAQGGHLAPVTGVVTHRGPIKQTNLGDKVKSQVAPRMPVGEGTVSAKDQPLGACCLCERSQGYSLQSHRSRSLLGLCVLWKELPSGAEEVLLVRDEPGLCPECRLWPCHTG